MKINLFHFISNVSLYIPDLKSLVNLYCRRVVHLLLIPFVWIHKIGEVPNNCKNIAFFSPLPPIPSGISDYTVDLIDAFPSEFNFYIFVDDDYPMSFICKSKIKSFYAIYFNIIKRSVNFLTIVYQIGGSRYHSYMYRYLEKHKGAVILHDGLRFRYAGDKSKLLHGCTLFVHSDYARNELLINGFNSSDVHKINQIMPVADSLESLAVRKQEVRDKLGIPGDKFIIGCFGIASPPKNISAVLRAIDSYFLNSDEFIFIMAGNSLVDKDVISFLKKHNDDQRFVFYRSPPLEKFYDLLKITDLCFNLRYPFYGVTSASLLRIMSCAIPAVVTDIGSFLEFPDDCVIKTSCSINIDEYKNIISRGYSDRKWLRTVGVNAYNYIKNEHSPVKIVNDILKVVL